MGFKQFVVRACADINTDEYDVLTNSSKKIMFFCSLYMPPQGSLGTETRRQEFLTVL